MLNSIRRTLISATAVLLMIGGSVAAATGFDGLPLASLAPSFSDDSPSTTSAVPGADDSSLSTSSTSTTLPDDRGGSTPGVDDNSSSTSSSSTTSTSTTNTLPAGANSLGESTTHQVAGVGTVSIVEGGGLLHVTDTTSIDGWSTHVERADAIEVEVSFRGPDGRVDFKAELEHDEIRIRVRDRRLETSGGSSGPDDSVGSSNSRGSDDSQSASTLDEVRTIDSSGGTVTARATGSDIILVAATPNEGWSMEIKKAGPDRVEVRFEKGSAENRIRLEVQGGMVTVDLEDSP